MTLYQRDFDGRDSIRNLQKAAPWLWLWCEGRIAHGNICHHHRAVAIAPFAIRFGLEASPDLIRRNARCSKCGHKGAGFLHPSWGRDDKGLPFPAFPVGREAG
jgi:hypothetical protein